LLVIFFICIYVISMIYLCKNVLQHILLSNRVYCWFSNFVSAKLEWCF